MTRGTARRVLPVAARLAVCLLAGGAVSSLAAQAMMLWAPVVQGDSFHWPYADEGLPADRNPSIIARNAAAMARLAELKFAADRLAPDQFRGYTEQSAYATLFSGRAVDVAEYTSVLPPSRTTYESRSLVQARSGWPFRCLVAHRVTGPTAPANPWVDALLAPRWLHAVDLPLARWTGGGPPGRPLAYVPIVPGLLANAVVVGTGLAAGWAALHAVRRAARRRLDRCPACGYDRRGLAAGAPCPECGAGGPA